MSVLPLESERWRNLNHAYGSASDTPKLLQRVARGDEKALGELYGSICHQLTVYRASYAAVPHLVRIAAGVGSPEFRAQVLALVGAIRAWSDAADLQALDGDLRSWYEAALPEALDLALANLKEDPSPEAAIYLLETAAALRGFVGAGRVLSGFADKEFAPTCPGCDRQLYVWPSANRLEVAAEDPVSQPHTPRTTVTPRPSVESRLHEMYEWVRDVAVVPALAAVRPLLDPLFGSATCPACGKVFVLMERLIEESGPGAA